MDRKIRIVCARCGSENVGRDAWASWDVESQQWTLGVVYDHAECFDCGSEALDEQEIEEETHD